VSGARDPEQIRKAFDALRETCDPRGHALLDVLQDCMLFDHATLALVKSKLDQVSVPGDAGSTVSRHTPEDGVGLVGRAGTDNVVVFPGHSVRVDGAA
jgi:hypothetical protein